MHSHSQSHEEQHTGIVHGVRNLVLSVKNRSVYLDKSMKNKPVSILRDYTVLPAFLTVTERHFITAKYIHH